MNEQVTSTGQGLEIQIIDLYGQLLLDKNLIFAIILAWAITHFIKQSPWVRGIKPVAKRKYTIRVLTIIIGFSAVMFFKRGMIDTHLDHVINFGVIVAFTHPILYKIMTSVLDKFMPTISANLKSK